MPTVCYVTPLPDVPNFVYVVSDCGFPSNSTMSPVNGDQGRLCVANGDAAIKFLGFDEVSKHKCNFGWCRDISSAIHPHHGL